MLGRKQVLIILTMLLAGYASSGQNKELDSLTQLLNSKPSNTKKVDILNELAYQYADINDTLTLEYAKSANDLAKEIEYYKGVKYSYSLLGLGYNSRDYQLAIAHFRKSDKTVAANSNQITLINYIFWGNLYGDLAKYDSALYLYKKAKSIAQNGSSIYQITIYKNIAIQKIALWQNEEALKYLDSASSLLQSVKHDYLNREVLNYKGIANQNLLRFDLAESYFLKLCKLSNKSTNHYHQIECSLSRSRLYYMIGDYKKSLDLGIEALILVKKYNFAPQYVDVLVQVASNYSQLLQYDLTSEYLFRALSISERMRLDGRTAKIYNELAWLFKNQKKYKEALKYTQVAEDMYSEIGDKKGISESQNIKGVVLMSMKQYSEALDYFDKSLRLRKEINHVIGIAACTFNMGIVYLETNQLQLAKKYFFEVMVIEKRNNLIKDLALSYNNFASLLISDKNPNEAYPYILLAKNIADSLNLVYLKQYNAQVYSEYFEYLGDFKKALDYHKLYQNLADSVTIYERFVKVAEFEALYSVEKKEQELALLSQKQKTQDGLIKIQQAELNHKNTIIYSAFIGLFLVALGAIITYRYSIDKNETNKKLLRINTELVIAKEVADKANSSKSEFLANVSHELRTPLNGVIGFTDLLTKTPLNEAQQKYLSVASQSANSLLNLIDDILDFSKLEAGKLNLNVESFNLHQAVNQAADMVRHQTEKKNLNLLIDIGDEVPSSVVADEMRIKQVLINLLSNAVKFTERGEVKIQLRQISKSNTHSEVRFAVIDTGIGISEKNQQKIFEAFVQEDISTTKKFGGTGLGLTISNKLLALMGSKITLTSKVKTGSTFSFDLNLPLA